MTRDLCDFWDWEDIDMLCGTGFIGLRDLEDYIVRRSTRLFISH